MLLNTCLDAHTTISVCNAPKELSLSCSNLSANLYGVALPLGGSTVRLFVCPICLSSIMKSFRKNKIDSKVVHVTSNSWIGFEVFILCVYIILFYLLPCDGEVV